MNYYGQSEEVNYYHGWEAIVATSTITLVNARKHKPTHAAPHGTEPVKTCTLCTLLRTPPTAHNQVESRSGRPQTDLHQHLPMAGVWDKQPGKCLETTCWEVLVTTFGRVAPWGSRLPRGSAPHKAAPPARMRRPQSSGRT